MSSRQGLGATVTVEELTADPHPLLHRLRAVEPVSRVPALDAWLVTSHELSVEVMLDHETYTVDDPRFSTQQVIGPSMLSLDGHNHRRHRDPFAGPFRAARVRELSGFVRSRARELVGAVAPHGSADLRREIAAPLAVDVMTHVLDLGGVGVDEILGWYEGIVESVHVVTAGGEVPDSGRVAFEALRRAVSGSVSVSALLRTVDGAGDLTIDEIVSNVAVLLFGGIVTSESSSAIVFKYLLDDPELITAVSKNRSLVVPAVEEAFRLEPSAAAVDRYATRSATLGGAVIAPGDLVRVSLSGANRDPVVFDDPDVFDLHRQDVRRHLTFARGPHACLGIHLARLEAVAAVNAVLDGLENLRLDTTRPADIAGLVFRAPDTVWARWN